MINHWKYYAVTRSGEEVSGPIQGTRASAMTRLTSQNLQVIEMKIDFSGIGRCLSPGAKPSSASLAQFFEDFENMLSTGMSMSQILASLKDTTQDSGMLGVLSAVEQRIGQGESFHQALSSSRAFPWIVAVTLRTGEVTGRLAESCHILARYFKRTNYLRDRLIDALVYPSVVFTLLVGVSVFVGLRVIPKLQDLLPPDTIGQGATQCLLALSAVIRQYWPIFLLVPLAAGVFLVLYRKNQKESFDRVLYSLPVIGTMVKELDLAVYLLNLSVLLKSGVPMLTAIGDLNAVHPNQASKHFYLCRDYIFGGMSLWEAAKLDSFFPRVLVFTLHRGEELARLDEYCFNLSDYFNTRVAAKMDGLMHLIQPLLLLGGGIFLATIALAFLVPIYGGLTKIAGG